MSEPRTRVVILGAGFGGLELSARLAEAVPDKVEVTLIDQSDAFVFGFSKLDVMFARRSAAEVRLPYREIAKPSVEFRREAVVSIDPERRRVVTEASSYDADVLVVALGADLAPEATPGLIEGGHEFYSVTGAAAVRDVVARFDSGVAVIGVLGSFFKCPPAPYEAALLLDEHLSDRGVRDAARILVVTPMPMPIPVSSDASNAILGLLEERGIEHMASSQVTALDPATKLVHLKDGQQFGYDLFLGVPVHRAPTVVVDSGLAEQGWIPVDPATFATRFAGVYAVGDVTSAPVPRAGVFAEGEAATLADVLVAQLTGGDLPPPYQGVARCYVEVGGGRVGGVDANFLSGPSPAAVFRPPSPEVAAEKGQFATVRRRRWFGTDA